MPNKQKKVITAKNVGKVEVEAPTVSSGKGKGKKIAAPPSIAKKLSKKEVKKGDPLIKPRPKNFGIGQSVQPKRDLYRFVKWPKYIQRQRQKAILKQRIKVPPPYRPVSKFAKKTMLRLRAQDKANDKPAAPLQSKITVRKGVREVTSAIMSKKAKLVLIAHDVEPIEIVLAMPALCRKMNVPYAIIKGKAELGTIVRRKRCSCVCFTKFRDEDKAKATKLIETVNNNYILRYDEIRKQWGGGVMGNKSIARVNKLEKAKAKEIGVVQ